MQLLRNTEQLDIFENPLYWHFIAYENHKRQQAAQLRLKKISKLLDYYFEDDTTINESYLIDDIRACLTGERK